MKSMFAPGECFKGAVGVFVVSYCGFRYIYHHTGHSSLIGALILAAIPAVFGIVGFLEGFRG